MTSLSPLAALAFLIPALPISIWVAWSDMKSMKIPNKAVMALGAAFLIVGLGLVLTGLLSFTAFLWALGLGLIVLAAGFLGNAAGLFGLKGYAENMRQSQLAYQTVRIVFG